MLQSVTLPFPEYRPDVAPINSSFCDTATNVVPSAMSYRPLASTTAYSGALGARCQGAVAIVDNGGNALNFAGDATKLYKLSTATWADVTGTPLTTPADENVSFAKFGNLVIAVNGSNTPQSYNITSSSVFADLAGSPPAARYITVVRDFVVLGNVSGVPNAIQWSGFNNATQWTVGANQSDTQEFPDGGWVQGIVGGDVMYVFQEKSIRRGTYVGGDLIFQFDEIAQNRGLAAPGSLAKVGDKTFFLDYDGFYVLAGDQVMPIGKERVDKTFFTSVNQSYLYRVQAAIDPINSLVIWGYPSTSSSDGTLDSLLIYNWAIDRFSTGLLTSEYIYGSLGEGYTLEQLDAFGTLETLPFSLDSRVWTGGSVSLGVFGADHELSYLTGANLEASLSTGEAALMNGRRAFVNDTRPVVDSDAATVAVGVRERFADATVYTPESTMEVSGNCPVLASGRYGKARLTIPAGTSWSHASAIDLFVRDAGTR